MHRDPPQSPPAAVNDAFVATSQKSSFGDLGSDAKADGRSPSPHGKRASPLTARDLGSQCPPKPPRLSPSPAPSVSPLLKRRKAEAARTSPVPKVSIPAIVVEDEPMETECGEGTRTRRKEGRVRKSKKGRPRSPEEGRTLPSRSEKMT